MLIFEAQLPPKVGYIEDEVDGERVYRNESTGILLRDENPSQTISGKITALEQSTYLFQQATLAYLEGLQ